MSSISVKNLTFSYEGSFDNVFENISFNIDTNWKTGFIGQNGKGKTTLFNLFLNKYEYVGKITSSVDFCYFPFEIEDKTAMTIDALYSVNPEFELWELQKEISKLFVDESCFYRPFNTLSNGEQIKIMLAVLFLKENSFLLIDEPTNHLDEFGREKVAQYLSTKKGFILVSHDRSFLDKCVDHILSINNNGMQIQNGNFTSWFENKKRIDDFETAKNIKLKKEIKRLNFASERAKKWSDNTEKQKYNNKNSGLSVDKGYVGHKSAKMMKRSKAMENRIASAVQQKQGLMKNVVEEERLKISPLDFHTKELVSFKNVSIYYDEKKVCENINFTLNSGEKQAVSGKNGCGKSSILKLILGENIKYTGDIFKQSGLKISYVPQNTSHLNGSLTEFSENKKIDESLFKAILRKMGFSREQFLKNIENFSEGQKKKVLIAVALCEKSHIYIFDEPLNFIDIYSRIAIEKMIENSNITMIFVEHDKTFREKIADKTIII